MADKKRVVIQNRLRRTLPIICTDGSTLTLARNQRTTVGDKVLNGYHYKSLLRKKYIRKIKDVPPPTAKPKAERPKASKPVISSSSATEKRVAKPASPKPKSESARSSDVKDGEAE